MNLGAEGTKLVYVLGAVHGPAKGAECYLMPGPGEVLQYEVSADLGAGVQRIGNEMRQEKNTHPSTPVRLTWIESYRRPAQHASILVL
jgi:hypothetical protein